MKKAKLFDDSDEGSVEEYNPNTTVMDKENEPRAMTVMNIIKDTADEIVPNG